MEPVSKSDPEDGPYRAEGANEDWRIVDSAGKVALVCGSEANASQYAVLLNQAYRRGYKAGYRKARGGSVDNQ
jgi:hypothetical protein